MSYSARIMNLPASPLVEGWASDERHNYKIGHRDARHAAAEIAAEADRRLEAAQRLADALIKLINSDDGAISKASDADLEEAVHDREAPPIVRRQAAAMLNARAALAEWEKQ